MSSEGLRGGAVGARPLGPLCLRVGHSLLRFTSLFIAIGVVVDEVVDVADEVVGGRGNCPPPPGREETDIHADGGSALEVMGIGSIPWIDGPI